jgi:hypothetical protein
MTSSDPRVSSKGSDAFPKLSPDDMQDVPLHNSDIVEAAARSQSPASSSGTTPTAHLHFPPKFPLPCKQCALHVRVHTPETASHTTLGIPTTHTVFHVETHSSLGSFPKENCMVKRRFSDFAALYSLLRARFTGYFIPRLPDKDLVQGKLMPGKSFLSKRCQDLEVFMNLCCCHEILQPCKVLTQSLPARPGTLFMPSPFSLCCCLELSHIHFDIWQNK